MAKNSLLKFIVARKALSPFLQTDACMEVTASSVDPCVTRDILVDAPLGGFQKQCPPDILFFCGEGAHQKF